MVTTQVQEGVLTCAHGGCDHSTGYGVNNAYCRGHSIQGYVWKSNSFVSIDPEQHDQSCQCQSPNPTMGPVED